jgi:hypothetical protein
MPKRARESLTGGSGDVNPQEMVSPLLDLGSASAYAVPNGGGDIKQLPLPIPRIRGTSGSQTVIELLWASFYWTTLDIVLGGNLKYINITTNPNNPATIEQAISDPRTIADNYNVILSTNAANTSVSNVYGSQELDFTDNAGHGVLIATDQIYFNAISVNTTTPPTLNDHVIVRIGYRFKNVGLVEYIGIVQSQQ